MMATQLLQTLHNVDDSYSGITPYNVKAALSNPIKLTNKPNPLECLLIVDDYLSLKLFPNSPYSRQIALLEILITIVSNQLMRHRHVMEIPCQPQDSTRKEAFAAIKRDVKTGNNQLIGWSWLYYGYVRIDLDITHQMFAQRTHFAERSIRRYQESTISRITEILILKEAVARRSRILESEVSIRGGFAEDEIKVSLKAHTILAMIQSDQSLEYAFIELLMKTDKILFSMEPNY